MRKSRILIILIAFALSSFHCHKSSSSSCYYFNLPPTFFFIIKQNGQCLNDTILQKIKVSYFKNGKKEYLIDIYSAVDYYANKGILTSRTIGVQSADQNTKSYYIEYSNGWNSDTLFVDYTSPLPVTNCQYVMKPIKFNTKFAPVDTSFHYQPVYILNR